MVGIVPCDVIRQTTAKAGYLALVVFGFEGELRDILTWTLFYDRFGSEALMLTTVFEVGQVLSVNSGCLPLSLFQVQFNPLGQQRPS